jgi:hypothetical protein
VSDRAAFGFADALHGSLTHPEAYRFRGDTLGVDVSLAWVAPAAYAVFLMLTLVWALRHARGDWRRPVPPWTRHNGAWLLGLAALVPLQFALLRAGGPGSTADQIGVVLTIVQWFLTGKAFAPAAAAAAVGAEVLPPASPVPGGGPSAPASRG